MKLRDLLSESIDINKAKELAAEYKDVKEKMDRMTGRAMDTQAYDDLFNIARNLEVTLSKAGYNMEGDLLKSGEKSALSKRVDTEREYNAKEDTKEDDEEFKRGADNIKGSLVTMIDDMYEMFKGSVFAGEKHALSDMPSSIIIPKVISYPYKGDILKNNVSTLVELIFDKILPEFGSQPEKFKNRVKPTAIKTFTSTVNMFTRRKNDAGRTNFISDKDLAAAQKLASKL